MKIRHEGMQIRSYEMRMIEENRAYWEDGPKVAREDKWIYVFHMRGPLEYALCEDVVAKGLQKKEKMPIASIIDGEPIKRFEALDESFGIRERFQIRLEQYTELWSRIRTYFAAKYFSYTSYKDRKKLTEIKYRKIPCGNGIYDQIIRFDVDGTPYTPEKYRFDCFDLSRKDYFRYLRNAFSIIDQSYELFKKRKPAYYISYESVFFKGICGTVARAMGARFIWVSGLRGGYMAQGLSAEEPNIAPTIRGLVECYLKRNPPESENTRRDQDIFVIQNQGGDSGGLRLEELKGKKNVFIMPHLIVDMPREACKHTAYYDYHEWLLDTLRIIRTVPGVNWIMKDHPLSLSGNQSLYMKELFEKYKTDNMYWCDKEVSGMQIREIADCVVTCAGDAGIEYWAFGIPTISTAEAWYVPLGISYNMRSREEYEAALRGICDIQPPPEESVRTAMRYLRALKQMGETDDCLAKLFYSTLKKKVSGVQRYSNAGAEVAESVLCREYIRLLKSGEIQKSTFYQLDGLCEISW